MGVERVLPTPNCRSLDLADEQRGGGVILTVISTLSLKPPEFHLDDNDSSGEYSSGVVPSYGSSMSLQARVSQIRPSTLLGAKSGWSGMGQVDEGSGMAQVVPVLVSCMNAVEGTDGAL